MLHQVGVLFDLGLVNVMRAYRSIPPPPPSPYLAHIIFFVIPRLSTAESNCGYGGFRHRNARTFYLVLQYSFVLCRHSGTHYEIYFCIFIYVYTIASACATTRMKIYTCVLLTHIYIFICRLRKIIKFCV